MRILTRYVVSELLKTMILALTVLTMILLLVMLAQRAMREGLGPLPVLRLVPFIMPDALRLSIPAATLFATCSVYGKMASSRFESTRANRWCGYINTCCLWCPYVWFTFKRRTNRP